SSGAAFSAPSATGSPRCGATPDLRMPGLCGVITSAIVYRRLYCDRRRSRARRNCDRFEIQPRSIQAGEIASHIAKPVRRGWQNLQLCALRQPVLNMVNPTSSAKCVKWQFCSERADPATDALREVRPARTWNRPAARYIVPRGDCGAGVGPVRWWVMLAAIVLGGCAGSGTV